MKDANGKVINLMPPKARALVSGKGKEVVRQVGLDVIRDIVCDVLCGKNLRDSTEVLTRKKLATINAATLVMFIRGEAQSKGFAQHLPVIASEELQRKLNGEERQILQWFLGLTNKATQNVLRDSTDSLSKYRDEYLKTCEDVISTCETDYGKLRGELQLGSHGKTGVDWNFMIELLQTIGAQTLAIRGSEKSTYGKLFERLILGSLLSIFGFKLVPKNNITTPKGVFWLSSIGDKRESDATLLYQAGKGIRFDIGFIGRGNPEISLDKVSRFEREIELGSTKWFMGTIILVDTIGKRSRIVELAKAIQGTIIQMSMAYWPKQVALELNNRTGFTHELTRMPEDKIQQFLKKKMIDVPLESFITKVVSK
ncbi:MAG: CfrBI family restriction endonuclease [Dehalococcoidales bacterium]|nr:CfrBI family restriction endonuclease [Dehalococcoidales bacterium]